MRSWTGLVSESSTKINKKQIYLKCTYSKSCLFFSFFFFPLDFWGSCSLAAPAPSISAAKASRSMSSLALKWKQRRPKCYSRAKQSSIFPYRVLLCCFVGFFLLLFLNHFSFFFALATHRRKSCGKFCHDNLSTLLHLLQSSLWVTFKLERAKIKHFTWVRKEN